MIKGGDVVAVWIDGEDRALITTASMNEVRVDGQVVVCLEGLPEYVAKKNVRKIKINSSVASIMNEVITDETEDCRLDIGLIICNELENQPDLIDTYVAGVRAAQDKKKRLKLTREEFDGKMAKAKKEYDVRRSEIGMEWINSNKKFSIGDIIRDNYEIIMINRIERTCSFNVYPGIMYSGKRLKKDLSPRKDGTISHIGENSGTLIKKAGGLNGKHS